MIPGLILMLPGLALLYPAVAGLRKRVDWREIGGAPLLGVNGVVVIGHGRSDAVAVQSMIRMAEKSVQQNLVQAIRDELAARGGQVGTRGHGDGATRGRGDRGIHPDEHVSNCLLGVRNHSGADQRPNPG